MPTWKIAAVIIIVVAAVAYGLYLDAIYRRKNNRKI